jgi:hypothetical protein
MRSGKNSSIDKTESEVCMPKSVENREGFTEEEQQLWNTTVKTGADMRRMFNMRDERRRREWEEDVKEQWPSTKAGQLFTQLAEAFTACQQFVEQHPKVPEMAQIADGEQHDVFTMLRDNLEKANRAPRCEHPKSNGQLCRAPKMRGEKYCCSVPEGRIPGTKKSSDGCYCRLHFEVGFP